MSRTVRLLQPFEFTARVFDEIMRDFPYAQWLDYIESLMVLHGRSAISVLDVACGTGSLAMEMARCAYGVAGVDASADMIEVAREKCARAGLAVRLSVGDMRDLGGADPPLAGGFELVTCTFDSLNALTGEGDLLRALRSVRGMLRPGGTFVADFNTPAGLASRWGNRVVRGEAGGASYEWTYSYDPAENIARLHMEYTLAGSEEVLAEEHSERGFEAAEVADACRRAGLEPLGLYDDRSFDRPDASSDRVFVIAGRPGGRW